MSKILIIVESPGKIKKIEKILGSQYIVAASYGHIMDLNPSTMSVEIDNNFKPIYIINTDKREVVKKIKTIYNSCKDILIASDKDREGEAIAWCISDILKLKNAKRITFNSITKNELLEAIKSPNKINQNMVNAQKARRILDRIAGYELSPLLDKHLGQKKLSAGRVQSVTARLIVDRENEIKKYLESELKSFYKFKGSFNSKLNSNIMMTQVYNLNDTNKEGVFKGDISKFDSLANGRKFLNLCIDSIFTVSSISTKKRTQGPSAPFTTATLQQEANRKFGFTAKRTMGSAQRLYEEGLITYMRTDSVKLSDEAINNIKKFVEEKYGPDYYRKMEYKTKSQNAQEAHEAVRPSDVNIENVDQHGGKIGSDEIRLYNLIWKRTVASQMQPAEFDVTSIQIIISKDNDHYFMTNIENLKFAGFLLVYNISNIVNDGDEDDSENKSTENKNIKIPKKGTILNPIQIEGAQEYLKPPGRFTEAGLIDKLDHLSISRPATLAPIIEKIKERNYVAIKDLPGIEKDCTSLILNYNIKKIEEKTNKTLLCKEKNKFVPTHLGMLVTNFLIIHFPEIMDYKFTARMEDKLDEIAEGKLVWNEVLKEFYNKFHPLVLKMQIIKPEIDKHTRLLGADPKTGGELYATIAKFGPVVKLFPPDKHKPQFAPIKEPLTIETITIQQALKLFEYPKELGLYEHKKILLNKGQFGFYITSGNIKFSVERDDLTHDEVVKLIEDKKKKPLAEFKEENKNYYIYSGPYGNYISIVDHKKKIRSNISLPNNEKIEELNVLKIKKIIENYYNTKYTKNKENNNSEEKIKIPKKVIKKAIKKKINIE